MAGMAVRSKRSYQSALGPDAVLRDRGSSKNFEIKDFWFFGTPGTLNSK